ncbi:MAG TPA: hypothetical protein DCM05_02190 [Elusimicrobia bacterium]|nr:hypothetical protein [Elusimicrobiota bacterium]
MTEGRPPEGFKSAGHLWLRACSALAALLCGYELHKSFVAGVVKFGTGGGHGRPSTRTVILSTPTEFAFGALFLGLIALMFGGIALKPRFTLRVKVLAPLIGAIVLIRLLVFFLFEGR